MGTDDLSKVIEAKLLSDEPFSLVRISDGDGLLLGWDQHRRVPAMWQQVRFQLLQWFGRDDLNSQELEDLRSGLLLACDRATAIAVPSERAGLLFRHAREQAARFGFPRRGQIVANHNVHFELQRLGLLRRIIQSSRSVAVVTCRESIRHKLAARTAKPVRLISVPADTRTESEPHGTGDTGHLDVYRRIREACFREPEQLTLVGAGVLGKLYTTDAARGGAVALDIGSVFDGWAGLATRSTINLNRERYSLDWSGDDAR